MNKMCLILFLFFSYFMIGQTNQKQQNLPSKLMVSLGEYGTLVDAFVIEKQIPKVQYINDGQFLGKEPYTFDPILLTQEIERAVPNANEDAIVYIDLESPYLDHLINDSITSDSFKKSLRFFIDVIQFAKKMRPNSKWGYYYLPFATYWDRSSVFYDKHLKIKELIECCDVLFPSLYTFYEEKTKDWKNENEKYIKYNIENFIKIRQYYNKPVLVFVWHRYHNSNPNVGMKLIPKKIFQKQIKLIINSIFEHQKIDGIVWWGADNYSFRQKDVTILREFKGSESEYKEHNDKVLYQYMKIIDKIIN